MQTKEEAKQFLADLSKKAVFIGEKSKKVIEIAIPSRRSKKWYAFEKGLTTLVRDYLKALQIIATYQALITEMNDENIPMDDKVALWKEFNDVG